MKVHPWSRCHWQLLGCILVLIASLLFVVGCEQLTRSQATPKPTGFFTPTNTPTPTLEPATTPTGPITLRVWIPPQLGVDSPAWDILQARLDQFAQENPNLKIEVRVKALEGSGGMLDALSASSVAAPLVSPDLVALPRSLLEAAALKGLLHPFDDQSLSDPDWYDYARQLGRVQKSTFGLPFAGDMLVLVYRSGSIGQAPEDWQSLQATGQVLLFPAADPQALFTLAQYQAEGGAIQNDQGRPTLDPKILTRLFTFYSDAGRAGVLPYLLTQYDTDQQCWQAYSEGQAPMVITWASNFLSERPADSTPAMIPTANGTPFTLANGWVWSLPNSQAEQRAWGTKLAEYLTEPDFVAAWTTSAGYLPTRVGALANWGDATTQVIVARIVSSTSLVPSTDLLASLGPVLRQATAQVLKMQSDPATAAQEAADYLSNP
jgi:multiple sugar transport system substrate-binding protein